MFEKIRTRYLMNYIRDDQLGRYVDLGVVTSEQAAVLKAEKYGEATE